MKCNKKECENEFCESPINHLKRVEGQMKKIREYIEKGEKCQEIALLLKSVSNSFESAKNNILRNFVLDRMGRNQKISKKELEKINKVFNSFKK